MKSETFPINLSPAELRTIILSHGWFDLPPFKVDVDKLTMDFPYDNPAGRGHIKIAEEKAICQLTVFEGDTKTARAIANHCLSLDMDIAPLHALVASTEFAWIAKGNYGRYLRGCTLFEDCFKIMLTTNVAWSRTKTIVQRMVDTYGRTIDGVKAFPLPDAFKGVTSAQLQKTTGCGYRAKGLLDLCRHAMQSPELFTGNAWQQLSGDDFASRLQGIKGLGPMCVTYLCRFYGKPGKFTIDVRVMGRCDALWKVKQDTKAVEAFALKRYQQFGDYAASVFWFEITRYWHERPFKPGDWWK